MWLAVCRCVLCALLLFVCLFVCLFYVVCCLLLVGVCCVLCVVLCVVCCVVCCVLLLLFVVCEYIASGAKREHRKRHSAIPPFAHLMGGRQTAGRDGAEQLDAKTGHNPTQRGGRRRTVRGPPPRVIHSPIQPELKAADLNSSIVSQACGGEKRCQARGHRGSHGGGGVCAIHR